MVITASILLIAYGILLLIYRSGWKRLPEFTCSAKELSNFISVIIPARNEAHNIDALLGALSKQAFPVEQFEVIIVDDHSTDGTSEKILAAAIANVRVLHSNIDAALSSKKRALEFGISQAKGELIVTTDADCIPPPNWLQCLHSFQAATGAAFVAAPVQYQAGTDWFSRFQEIDFMMLQGITAASVSLQLHDMCNGANLAYTRQAFEKVNGFAGIDHVASGDDLLLMHKIRRAFPSQVFYLKSAQAIVTTAVMPGIKEFLVQRKRWASKTLVYEDARIIMVLAFIFILNLFAVATLFSAPWSLHLLPLLIFFFIIKALLEALFLAPVAQFYKRRNWFWDLLLFQPLHALYTVFTGVWSQVGGYEWKGRKTK
jgi:cellulose synthase/poly-beta-1,6-N-acetylglucosamine synthase-like glycosyltransferase